MIREVEHRDVKSITEIYNHYILHTIVSFEEESVSESEVLARIERVTAEHPWLVCESEGKILGYAYAGRWQVRSAYRHTVESTVYLDHRHVGRGVGTRLYRALLDRLRERGVHAVVGGVSLPNAASVSLHEKMGYEKVAHYKEVGFKFGKWIDVGYWQLTLDEK